MNPHATTASQHRSTYRRRAWLVVVPILLLSAMGAWLLGSAQGNALQTELRGRSPQELIRYALRRLEGHTKLEWALHPLLFAAQRHVEREPPGSLPPLGKGQRPTPFEISGAITQEVQVDTPQAIREALLTATAGTRITVAPGFYPFSSTLRLRHAGLNSQPIVLTAQVPGTVLFEFSQVEGILVDQPEWVFENLNIRGVCRSHDDCEHAFHVVGAAEHTVIRNNAISDFNAHIKVNGYDAQWPDHGLLQQNTMHNRAPRNTTRSVTPFDLVGAYGWRVEDNLVKDFAKAIGNKVSYGLFMKGASENGRIERNLIICSSEHISAPGIRVGISFGGGGTGPNNCRQGGCKAFEHRNGLAANNVVAHCNDVGIDINHSIGILVAHNTLVNTVGIGSRLAPAEATLHANLVDGGLFARDGTQLRQSTPPHTAQEWLGAADRLKIDPQASLPRVQRAPMVTNDFFLRTRQSLTAPGATEATAPKTSE